MGNNLSDRVQTRWYNTGHTAGNNTYGLRHSENEINIQPKKRCRAPLYACCHQPFAAGYDRDDEGQTMHTLPLGAYGCT